VSGYVAGASGRASHHGARLQQRGGTASHSVTAVAVSSSQMHQQCITPGPPWPPCWTSKSNLHTELYRIQLKCCCCV